jgi:hypothetical protein
MNLKKNYSEKLMKFDNFSTKRPTNPIKFLPALAAGTVQSRHFLKACCQHNYLNEKIKNEDVTYGMY